MHRLQTTALTIAAIALCVLCCPAPPASAASFSPLVNKAGNKLCAVDSKPYITGCKFYLHARINEQKSIADAQHRCFSRCLEFKDNTQNWGHCKTACSYLVRQDR